MKKKILLTLLALVVIISLVTVTASAETAAEAPSFTGANVVLESIMRVNFYTPYEGGIVKIAVGTADAIEVAPSETSEVEGCYEYAIKVFAQDMTKDIKATLYNESGEELCSETFILADYVADIKGNYAIGAEMQGLAEATLTYCQYAAILKGNYTGEANALGTLADDAFANYSFDSAMGTAPGLSISGYLEEACQLRLRLAADYATGYTVTVDGVETAPVAAADGTYLCATEQILPQDYEDVHTFIVTDAEGNVIYNGSVSVMAYIGRCLETDGLDENIQNLLIAMCSYYEAAEDLATPDTDDDYTPGYH